MAIVFGVLVLLLVGSLIYNVVTTRVRIAAEEGMKDERLRTEAFLSEKLVFEKENVKLTEERSMLHDSIYLLNERSKLLEARLKEAIAIAEKNKTDRRDFNQLQTQLKSGNELRKELEKRLEDIGMELAASHRSWNLMEDSIAGLHATIEQLSARNEDLEHRALDNALVMLTKGNGKLTIKSKQVKKLIINTEIPGPISTLKLELVAPDGTIIVPSAGELVVDAAAPVSPAGNAFYIAPTRTGGETHVTAEMTYSPAKKLQAGVYRIIVSNGDFIVGSLQVKLR